MNKHYKFPKIGQYHQVLRNLKLRHQYVGKDENDDPIYDNTTKLPVIEFIGYTKLHGCVAEDTEVLLSDGSTKKISDLRVGTSIISYNEESGETENDTVLSVLSDELDKDWVRLKFDNSYTLECTEDHPIFTKNRGWVEAINLDESDEILCDEILN